MKTIIYFAIGMFATLSFSQNNSQGIWFNFQAPASEVITDKANYIQDIPFVLKDKYDNPTHYTIPAYFKAVSNPNISDILIVINHISAKFDRHGRQILYLSGKIDLSCCFEGTIVIDFYDVEDNLVQKATTDEFGDFKIKSVNGNMFLIKGNKVKLMFSKIKTFDQNADVRIATIERIKNPLESDTKTAQEKGHY